MREHLVKRLKTIHFWFNGRLSWVTLQFNKVGFKNYFKLRFKQLPPVLSRKFGLLVTDDSQRASCRHHSRPRAHQPKCAL